MIAGIIPEAYMAGDRLFALFGVIALAIVYLVMAMQQRSYTVKFTNLPLLDTVAPRRPGWRRHVTALAFLAAIALSIVSWARPADKVLVPRERATLVLAIDTSLSMESSDVPPSRLVAAQSAALDFVNELPPEINVGLVSFNGVAQVRVTPTTDRAPVLRAIETLQLGEATAIGEAIFAGIQAVQSSPLTEDNGEPVPARIVLMTDGKTTVGRPDADGATAAITADIPVWTIAFGTDGGTIFIDGDVQPVPVEEASLRDIAEQTGGRFFRAESLSELTDVYSDIGSSVGLEEVEAEVTHRYVGYALVMLVLSSVLSLLFFQRIP